MRVRVVLSEALAVTSWQLKPTVVVEVRNMRVRSTTGLR